MSICEIGRRSAGGAAATAAAAIAAALVAVAIAVAIAVAVTMAAGGPTDASRAAWGADYPTPENVVGGASRIA